MKTSSIISLLSLALGVFALPQGPQDLEPRDLEALEKGWPPEEPPPVNDIVFSWCRDYNMSTTCFAKALKHGWCYDLPLLDVAIRDQLEDVGASGGQCMLYDSFDCKGEHTAMFVGEHLWTKYLCPKSKIKWHRSAGSVRCCAGTPMTPWCNGQAKKPESCSR
ncbi:hypothetical protein V8C37DRAFT_382450 [Trichoderma ceciliae]